MSREFPYVIKTPYGYIQHKDLQLAKQITSTYKQATLMTYNSNGRMIPYEDLTTLI